CAPTPPLSWIVIRQHGRSGRGAGTRQGGACKKMAPKQIPAQVGDLTAGPPTPLSSSCPGPCRGALRKLLNGGRKDEAGEKVYPGRRRARGGGNADSTHCARRGRYDHLPSTAHRLRRGAA